MNRVENFSLFHMACYFSVPANFAGSFLTMLLLVSVIAFVVLLTLLIIIHELGHFLLAKLFKVDVEEFGFGLPPRAKTLFRAWNTAFTLNWIPFGGFVRLKGENEVSLEKRYSKGSFAQAGIPQRVCILLGGVAMNFALAFVLLVFGFSYGRWVPNFYMQSLETMEQAAADGDITVKLGVYINDVMPDGPAAKAGVVKDSAITAVNGHPVVKPEDVIALQSGQKEVVYQLLEGKEATPKTVTVTLDDGKSGIAISPYAAELAAPRRSIGRAVALSIEETKFMTVQTVKGMADLVRSLVTKAHVPEGITGIVGIAVLTYSSVQEGLMTYLRLVALLSLSLAILNVLPLPALDGGRLLFVLIEAIIRRPLNQRLELMTNAIGFFVLIGLIIIITFNDVIHLF